MSVPALGWLSRWRRYLATAALLASVCAYLIIVYNTTSSPGFWRACRQARPQGNCAGGPLQFGQQLAGLFGGVQAGIACRDALLCQIIEASGDLFGACGGGAQSSDHALVRCFI